MKKSVFLVLFILCLSFAYASTVFVDNLTVLDKTNLTFNGDSTDISYLSLPGNAWILSSSMILYGDLSDWEVVYFYNQTLSTPLSGKYVSPTKWLITDSTNNIAILVNPQTGIEIDNYTSNGGLSDAVYIADDKWLIADQANSRVILVNANTDSILESFTGLSNPESVYYINDTDWLIADTGNDRIIYVDASTDSIIYTLSISSPRYIQPIGTDGWLLTHAQGLTGEAILYNTTLNKSEIVYSGLGNNVRKARLQPNSNNWLIAVPGAGVILVNASDNASYPTNLISEYSPSSPFTPYDADYIGENDWLITDKDGIKRVHEQKKYYPTNPTLSIDTTQVWDHSGELKGYSSTITNCTNELNNFLKNITNDSTINQIPLVFHSETSGIINITNFNLTYNQIPSVTVTYPNGGEYLSGNQTINWSFNDDDNDTLLVTLEYFNSTDWVVINASENLSSQLIDTNDLTDGDYYLIKVTVNDSYNNASDTSDSNFTIDNTQPALEDINLTMQDMFYRHQGITVTANVSDAYLGNVTADIVCPSNSTTLALVDQGSNVYEATWTLDNTTQIGTCTINVNATDLAGNLKTSSMNVELKAFIRLYLELTDSNPSAGQIFTAQGGVTYDNGSAIQNMPITVTYLTNELNGLTEISGAYYFNFTASTAGNVIANVTDNGEEYSDTEALTIYSGSGGGGGGGGGSSNRCGNGVCELNRDETCTTCPKDCGYCQPDDNPLGHLTTMVVEEEESGEDDSLNTGILENVTEEGSGDSGILQEEPGADSAAVGGAFQFFNDLLKSPITLWSFVAIVGIITTLALVGKGKKKKRKDFLKEFGD